MFGLSVRSSLLSIVAAAVLSLSAVAAEPKELFVGDAAPPLAVKTFVKGEPVEKFAKGKIYVLDFWATFCPPCLEAIPHISELQAKHKDVVFIGVDVREKADPQVRGLVRRMGNKMNFRVAIDADDPDSENENSGKMARTWLDASHQYGLPCAAIVDGTGKVAWIGDPREIDEPLEKIIAGKWDLAAASKTFKAEVAVAKAGHELIEQVNAALEGDDPTKVIAVLDAGFAKTPVLEQEHCTLKLAILLATEETRAKGLEYGTQVVEKLGKDNPTILFSIANEVLTNDEGEPLETLDPATGKLAVLATTRFAKLLAEFEGADNEDRSVAYELLAQAQHASGDSAAAIKSQEMAIQTAKGTEREQDADLTKKLKKYQQAAEKKPRVSGDTTKPKTVR